MAFRLMQKFADITPVAASGKATADLPASGTYYSILLHCLDGGAAVSVANIIADITNVRLTLDGTTVWEASAQAIFNLFDQRYNAYGASPQAGVLPILLSADHLESMNEAEITGYGMGGIGVMQLEIDFGASVGTSGHIDQVAVYAERIASTRPLGLHRELHRYERSFASSGDQEITDLPIEKFKGSVATAAYHLLYDGSAAVVQDVEVIVNSNVVKKFKPDTVKHVLERSRRKNMITTAAGSMFTIPFDKSNNLTGFLPHVGLDDFRIKVNWSAAPGAYTVVRESYHGIGQANK